MAVSIKMKSVDEAVQKLTVARETCFIGTPYRVLCFSDNPILT